MKKRESDPKISQKPESMPEKKHHNKLISEKSPYLLQHAHNPVKWYPWGPEAFRLAQKKDRPIFLSIGYSTCHWCHVMENESFEDPEVAKLMNDVFVSIKVDREERPDIDSVYMMVCQMLTGSGGWPLTILMTPDKKPFYAATYIPKETRFGRIGMVDLIPRVKEMWTTRRSDMLNSANQITESISAASREMSPGTAGEVLDESTLNLAYEQLSMRFDEQYGGFGSAPRFPTPHNLLFLLRYWRRSGDKGVLGMVEKTLQEMRRGGIYDHVGFGFHRYSTDSRWLVPHFEKMLYDQALLAMAYTEAYQATGKKKYEETAREIFTYVLRDMMQPEGGFYSAEDADSEGVEGKYYVWTFEEAQQVLAPEEATLIVKVFNIRKDGNFMEEATKEGTGSNILHLRKSVKELASDLKVSEEALQKRLKAIRRKLFDYREKRVHPHKDDKILTDWSGLMIAALAKGAQVFEESEYAEAAERAADFILKTMRTPRGRLLHRYRDGQAGIPAHIDDYAFLIWGLLELYEATFRVGYLETALDLNKDSIKHFWDEDGGGFYFTANDSEKLLVRHKEVYDGAIPSGNSVAMLNLLRLGRLTAQSDLEEKAATIGRVFSESISESPSVHTQLMAAVDFGIGPSYEVVIVGNPKAKDTKEMVQALHTHFIPNKVVLLRPTDQEAPGIERLAKFTKYQTSIDNKATAYVCLNYNCKLPTTDKGKMLELLKLD
ncbi:MAG: thioredoxin domain-containing protein [Deltaproteobacteria bacterium]|nr:thioredoxin domain-containing protein [Deltaproteobacteria bacterium]MBW2340030.1 thioredoxin domain-containing protein [Deltaproteobacteria bacterium]